MCNKTLALIIAILVLVICIIQKRKEPYGGREMSMEEILKRNKCPARVNIEYVTPDYKDALSVKDANSKVQYNERDYGTADKRIRYPTMDDLVLYYRYSVPSSFIEKQEDNPLYKTSVEDTLDSLYTPSESTTDTIDRLYGTVDQRRVFPTMDNLMLHDSSTVPTAFTSRQASSDLFEMSFSADQAFDEKINERAKKEQDSVL